MQDKMTMVHRSSHNSNNKRSRDRLQGGVVRNSKNKKYIPKRRNPFQVRVIYLTPYIRTRLSTTRKQTMEVVHVCTFVPIQRKGLHRYPFPKPIRSLSIIQVRISHHVHCGRTRLTSKRFLPIVAAYHTKTSKRSNILLQAIIETKTTTRNYGQRCGHRAGGRVVR